MSLNTYFMQRCRCTPAVLPLERVKGRRSCDRPSDHALELVTAKHQMHLAAGCCGPIDSWARTETERIQKVSAVRTRSWCRAFTMSPALSTTVLLPANLWRKHRQQDSATCTHMDTRGIHGSQLLGKHIVYTMHPVFVAVVKADRHLLMYLPAPQALFCFKINQLSA